MWIKYCGMTRIQDALTAQELGTDAIGFIFTKSPRQITPEKAAEICELVKIPKVGVFMDQNVKDINEIAKLCKLDYLQLHGNETPEFCEGFDRPVIKAFRVKDSNTIQTSTQYKNVWKKLYDAYVPGKPGGTGKQLDLDLIQNMEMNDIILAGGINPENILNLLSTVTPFGIDISSGIEDSPGIKNHIKMENLLLTVKEYITNA